MPPSNPLTVNFEGTQYSMPPDASDDEITELISNHQQAMHPPSLKRPQVPGLDIGSVGTGTFGQRMANAPSGDLPERLGAPSPPSLLERAGGVAVDWAKGLATSAVRGSAPNTAYQMLRKAVPRADIGEGVGTFKPEDAVNVGLAAIPEAEGESATPESAAIGRRSTSAPAPASGVADSTSASSASKLVSKIPGKRSVTQDVKDLMGTSLKNPLSWKGGLDAVKSILQRFQTGTPSVEGAASSAEEVAPRTAPASQFSINARPGTVPASRTTEFERPIAGQPKTSTILQKESPKPNVRPPLWKGITDQPVAEEPVAAQPSAEAVRGQRSFRLKQREAAEDQGIRESMQVPEAKSLLKRRRPNPITEDIEPEGPKRIGTGPGAMLKKGTTVGTDATIERDPALTDVAARSRGRQAEVEAKYPVKPGSLLLKKETGGVVPTQRVYHGTTAEAGRNIASEGLRPNKLANTGNPEYGGPYVTEDEAQAEEYAHGDYSNQPNKSHAIVAMDLPRTMLHKRDWDASPENIRGARAYNLDRKIVPPNFINHSVSRVLRPSGRADALDDQGIKQEIETKLRRGSRGSIEDETNPRLFDDEGNYQGDPNSISAQLMQRHSDEVTKKLLKRKPN